MFDLRYEQQGEAIEYRHQRNTRFLLTQRCHAQHANLSQPRRSVGLLEGFHENPVDFQHQSRGKHSFLLCDVPQRRKRPFPERQKAPELHKHKENKRQAKTRESRQQDGFSCVCLCVRIRCLSLPFLGCVVAWHRRGEKTNREVTVTGGNEGEKKSRCCLFLGGCVASNVVLVFVGK